MTSRKKKAKQQDLSALANAEFEPIEEADTWTGTRHAEWAEASEALRQAAVFATSVCAMDRAGVRKAVADLMTDGGGLAGVKELLDVWDANIIQCKALGEMLAIARARVLGGMAAYVEKPGRGDRARHKLKEASNTAETFLM